MRASGGSTCARAIAAKATARRTRYFIAAFSADLERWQWPFCSASVSRSRMKSSLALLALILSASAQEDGFVSLFNGKDLSGWTNVNCAPETWGVKDGMITCTG